MTFNEVPPDDIGALTAAWYRFQAELTSQACLAMLAGEGIEQIICEWHEDYVVVYRDDRSELVSVKHQEIGQQPWTIKRLCDQGGLAHLFDRWLAAGGRARCRLQTNSGMRPGVNEPAGLKDCCATGDPTELARWAQRLRPELVKESHGDIDDATIVAFLTDLRIDDGQPGREHVGALNLQKVVPPTLERIGRPANDAVPVYEAIVAEVEAATRLVGREDVLAQLADPTRFDIASEQSQRVAAKTLDRARLLGAVQRGPIGRTQLAISRSDNRDTVLVQKLKAGALGPTGINNARNLFQNWQGHVATWRADVPRAPAEFGDVQARVLIVAHAAENQVRTPLANYGPAMYDTLWESLEASGIEIPGVPAPDPALLMGCVMDLTEACEIWWSDPFELEPTS